MAKSRKSKVFSPVTHTFLVELAGGGELKMKARVRLATRPTSFALEAKNVQTSIRYGGVGDTQMCSVSCGMQEHSDAFTHPVTGLVDFTYTRAYVASRVDKFGRVIECYAYEHNHVDIAKLNDSAGGQKRLLADIQTNGPKVITLKPYRKRSEEGRNGAHRGKSGVRNPNILKGAKLRKAYAKNSRAAAAIGEPQGVTQDVTV